MNLTKIELQVLEQLAQGFTQREIAERRYRSADTIKAHVTHCMQKLKARNAVNLIAIAKDLGLIMVLVAVIGSCFRADQSDFRRVRLARSFSIRGGRVLGDFV